MIPLIGLSVLIAGYVVLAVMLNRLCEYLQRKREPK